MGGFARSRASLLLDFRIGSWSRLSRAKAKIKGRAVGLKPAPMAP